MEDMNIDQVVDIPDTPDRLAVRHIKGAQFGRESNSLQAGHARNSGVMDEECLNQLRAKSRLIGKNGDNILPHLHPRRTHINAEPRSKSVSFGPIENSYPSHNSSLFRRAGIVNNSKSETGHPIVAECLDKGKAALARSHSKSPFWIEDDDDPFDLTNFKPETRHSIRAQHMDKGKAVCAKVLPKSPVRMEHNDLNNSKLETGHSFVEEHIDKEEVALARSLSKSLFRIKDDDDFFDLANFKPGSRHSSGTQYTDKGKAVCAEVPPKSSVCIEDNDLRNSKPETEPSIGAQYVDKLTPALARTCSIPTFRIEDDDDPFDLTKQNGSQNDPLYGRAAVANNSKPEIGHCIGDEHMDNLKAAVDRAHSKPPFRIDNDDDPFDLTKQNGSQNDTLYGRAAVVKNSKPEIGHSLGAQHMSKIPSKPLFRIEDDDDLFDVTEENEHNRIFDVAFSCRASKDLRDEVIREGRISSYRGPSFDFASRICDNVSKGKEQIDNTFDGSGPAINQGKRTDHSDGLQHKIEKPMPASHLSVSSPRVSGQKRLVRNGCISPHNIAVRAQKLTESHQGGLTDGFKNHVRNEVSNGRSQVDIREVIAEENHGNKVKGKGLIVHPFTSKEHDAKTTNLSTSCCVINNHAANETANGNTDAVLVGWRRSRNCSKNIDQSLSNIDGILLGRDDNYRCFGNKQLENRVVATDNGNGNVAKDVCDREHQHASQTASRLVSGLTQMNHPHHRVNILTKRQRKHGLTSRNHGESSTVVPDDLDIWLLDSSQQPSSSRPSRVLNHQQQDILDPIYEVNELPPETRNSSSQGISSMNNDDDDSRARQVEADEMLARELQEQLYNETPLFGEGEIDENIAWALQQEENTLHAVSGQDDAVSYVRISPVMHSHGYPPPRSFQNPSNRRGAQVRVPTARTPQLRNRLFNQSPAAISRDRSRGPASFSRTFRFPADMDVDMRFDILEAFETATEDSSIMSRAVGHIAQVQRDFNENDYEMLLALDDNILHHGASVNQINNLPESVVQTDNYEETCAICIETPSTGETIRHLPCLHKFHKNCIDPWLRRRSSCPVCKSSIT